MRSWGRSFAEITGITVSDCNFCSVNCSLNPLIGSGFDPKSGPHSASYKADNPVKVIFAPAK